MADPTTLSIRNPQTGETLARVPAAGAAEVAAAFARARAAQPAWAALSFATRAGHLRQLAGRIVRDRRLGQTLVAESGKPAYEAEAFELLYVALLTRFLTGRRARRTLADRTRGHLVFPWKRSRVLRHPLGVVGVVGPWNFPLLNNYGDAIAPLLAGNAVLLKPSELTPLTSLEVARLAGEVGLPPGVLQVLPGGRETGEAVVAGADLVFFTGSVAGGRAVARAAAERLKPAVLELGGKSPFIVLADADLEAAAASAAWGAFCHSGQVCIRPELVLAETAVAERFVGLLAAATGRLRQGPPGAAWMDVGALTSDRQVAVVEAQLADAIGRGARLVCGGRRIDGAPGSWFAPTVLAGCTPDMQVVTEETFGPVLPVVTVSGVEEAVRLANASSRGLAGSVWSRDPARARAVARRLETGSVALNDVLLPYLCVEAPLGGCKDSGLGFRHGVESLLQFCRTESLLEDRPGLGWLGRRLEARLKHPYRPDTLRLLGWLARLLA